MEKTVKVKILGISGSPDKGNTDILVNECLAGARGWKGVETEFIHLADYKIDGPCVGCLKEMAVPELKLCHAYGDDLNDILKKWLAADGMIVGAPTQFGGESALVKIFIDRGVECAGVAAMVGLGTMMNKPFGVVTVGSARHGGQENTVLRMMHAFMVAGQIPLTPQTHGEPEGQAGFFGVTGQRGFPVCVSDLDPNYAEAVRQDKGALMTARLLGRRVAKLAKIIKAGTALVAPEVEEEEAGFFSSGSVYSPEIIEEFREKVISPETLAEYREKLKK